MHLKLDGHALVAGLASLRGKRKLPTATIRACPHEMGKEAEVTCGELQFSVPVFDRRCWSDTVAFDGSVLKSLASIPADDMFMDVCRVEYIAGRLVFAENISVPAQVVQAISA
jgi:hypothetical protein